MSGALPPGGGLAEITRQRLNGLLSGLGAINSVSPPASGADVSATLLAAIERAMDGDGLVVVRAGDYTAGALGALPTSGVLRIYFEPGVTFTAPGAGATAASDVTLMAPTTSTRLYGGATFVGYRRVFDFDGIEANATVEAEGLTFRRCGRAYDYSGANRQDFNGAFGCKSTVANKIKRLQVRDFRCEKDGAGNVCEFGVVWRGKFDEATIEGITTDGIGRTLVMLGDNATWNECKNIQVRGVTARDVYPRVGTNAESEVHAILLYGIRIIVDGVEVDTCYDTHATTHESEALYGKGVLTRWTNIHIRDGGRGDSYLALKGETPTAAQLADIDTIPVGTTGYGALHQIDGVTLQATPAFVAAYGKKSGIYVSTTRTSVGAVTATGAFDRVLSLTGNCQVAGPVHAVGNSNRVVFGVANAGDPTGFSCSNVYAEGAFSASVCEYRLDDASGALTIPEVYFGNIRGRALAGTTSGAALITIDVQKSNGQNTLTLARVSDCHLEDLTNSMSTLLAETDLDSGANEGVLTTLHVQGLSASGAANLARFTGTAGKIGRAAFEACHSGVLNTAVFSNPTLPASLTLRNMTGSYPSELVGTATVGAATTSVVVTPGFSSRQSLLYPNALHNIEITPGDMGVATKWWISDVTGGSFTMNVDAAPGGAGFTFGYRAKNRYHR